MSEEREYGNPTPIYEYLTPGSSDGTQGWAIFADPDAGDRPVTDYRLCLVPANDKDRFSIFQCTEELYIPDGAALMLSEDVDVVVFEGYQYNILACWMIGPEAVDQCESSRLVTFPEEMQGKRLPVTECPDKELLNLLLSSRVDPEQVEQSTDRGIVGRIKSLFD